MLYVIPCSHRLTILRPLLHSLSSFNPLLIHYSTAMTNSSRNNGEMCRGRGGAAKRLASLVPVALAILLPLSSTLMMWKALCLVTNSRSPIVCVISESMEPTFYRGDILLLWNRTLTIEVGDIPVVWFEGNPLPMVHRVIKVQSFSESEYGENHPC